MGVVTGVAGGILRDRLLGEMPLVFRPEVFLYATAAIFGALSYVGVAHAGFGPQQALWTGLLTTLLLRLAGIRWRIALPVFEPVDEPKTNSK
jgi:uncharacterized membrane protein YeiH